MPKKPKVFFATDQDGNTYVKVAAIMHPMIPFMDGLSMVFFGKEKPRICGLRMQSTGAGGRWSITTARSTRR